MKIVKKEKKEVICVLHKNVEAMKKNVEALQSEGWSDNIRRSISGEQIFKEELYSDEYVELMEKEHPEIEIQKPTSNGFLYKRPFVIVTEHERVID